ncbi:MAG: hypothetical protein H0T79_19170 [Deltaproteobacteria bacterium]|nr:hypothetical protein [Deltaproteobacteria bacterium]
MRSALLLVGSLVVVACGDDGGGGKAVDAPIGGMDDNTDDGMLPDGNPLTPDTLAGTGLCLDAGCTQFAADAKEYVPQYELWADGATKRRWITLPPGAKIDTSDMNYWKFPIGTKIWKEFTRDGVRVETRYMVKLADELEPAPAVSWYFVSYQWNSAQDDTVAVTQGAQNANGTQHDIPARALCRQCHNNSKGPDRDRGRVLGFGAMSLDWEAPAGMLDLGDLVAGDLLTAPPNAPVPGTYFPLPGTATDKAAFGYLHANCGHCHNPSSDVSTNGIAVSVQLNTTMLATTTGTPTYASTVDVMATKTLADNTTGKIIKPNDAPNSIMIRRMNSFAGGDHMPASGSELVDPTGQTVLVNWINSLP